RLDTQPLDDLVAAHARQHEIEDHEVYVRRHGERLERRFAGGRRIDLVAFALEQIAQQGGGVCVVLDDQEARGLRLHGAATSCVWSVVAINRASSSGVNGLAT